MAIQLFKENETFNVKSQHFLIDSTDELTNIESIYDCKQGDKAELPDGTIYVRHSDGYSGDLWEVRSSSGGSNNNTSSNTTSSNSAVGNVIVLNENTMSLPSANDLIYGNDNTTIYLYTGERWQSPGMNISSVYVVDANEEEMLRSIFAIDSEDEGGSMFRQVFTKSVYTSLSGHEAPQDVDGIDGLFITSNTTLFNVLSGDDMMLLIPNDATIEIGSLAPQMV